MRQFFSLMHSCNGFVLDNVFLNFHMIRMYITACSKKKKEMYITVKLPHPVNSKDRYCLFVIDFHISWLALEHVILHDVAFWPFGSILLYKGMTLVCIIYYFCFFRFSTLLLSTYAKRSM